MKALIADDDLALRFVLQKLLEGWGFEPLLVSDGEEAYKLMTETKDPPQILLIDWEMPKLNGIELCKKLRNIETSDPPYIILVTSHDKSDDIATALHAGANDFISKPTKPVELRARIGVGMRTLELQRRLNIANHILAYRAEHDELTGLRNRTAVIERFNKEIIRSQRTNNPLAIAICDIDFFKKVNDNYGHPVGDRVLREFAERLKDSFRPYDLLGRYGGEEFIIVCSASEIQAVDIFERFRRCIADTPFLEGELGLDITVSVGVRTYQGEPLETEQVLLSLVADADTALYKAKHRGKDQVCTVATSVSHYEDLEKMDQQILSVKKTLSGDSPATSD